MNTLRRILTVPLAGIVAFSFATAPAYAANSDIEFRDCMRLATINRENAMFDAYNFRNIDTLNAMNGHRERSVGAWDIEDDKIRAGAIRQVDKDFSTDLRNIDKGLRDALKNIKTNFRNDSKFCKDTLRDRQRTTR